MTDEEFETLVDSAKDRAFAIAGVNQLSLVNDVWQALDDSIASGTSFGDFKAAISDKLASAWSGPQPYRVKTIFRTWVQRSYAAGRYETMTHPAVKELRPFWEFIATLDGRTSPICLQCSGTIKNAADPWWTTHNPPLHQQCRSTAVTMTPEEAAGKADDPGPTVQADEGFGMPPTIDEDPDLSNFPAPLVAAYRQRQTG